MLTLRLAKRLAQRLGVKLTKDAPSSDGKLGDWFANIIVHPPVVVCVNTKSRLPLVIPALDAEEVVSQFRMRMAKLLDGIGVPDAAIEAEVNSTASVAFAPTNDRRVLGSMNDICFHVAVGLEDYGGMITESELFALEMRLARMPHVKQPDPYPDSVVRSVLGGVDPGSSLNMPRRRRRKIDQGEAVPVAFTQAERKLIVEHTLADPEPLKLAEVKGSKLVIKLTLDELEDLLGYIAAESNHTEDKKLQRRLDKVYERLQIELESYDDGL